MTTDATLSPRGRAYVLLVVTLGLLHTAIVIGPFLGSQLLLVMDWRGVFLSLAVYAEVVRSPAATTLRESLPRERRRNPGLEPIIACYRAVALDRQFLSLALAGGFAWAVCTPT